MNEFFLHYIWQYRLFNMKDLVSDDGNTVEIIKAGELNTSAGPDFFNAQVKIGDTVWAGNVEIHINSSDWHKHNHHTDPSYDSCILHVVYNYDSVTMRTNGSLIPTVQIAGRYSPHLWDNYIRLLGTSGTIACHDRLPEIDSQTWKNMTGQMIEERMEIRTGHILNALKGNSGDWQETFYQYLAKNFGFQINSMPFEMMARSTNSKILLREGASLLNIEALLFGQAGMLKREYSDNYPQQLFDAYEFFRKKYLLTPLPGSSWKFLRMRPVNFPTVRIAQFASLNFKSPVLMDELLKAADVKGLLALFDVSASDYWNNHYQFDVISGYKLKKIGKGSAFNLIINTCVPFIFAWGKYTGNEAACKRAIELLSHVPAEDNHHLADWKQYGVKVHNAVDSQALLQLKLNHCSGKKCLTCRIGSRLINTTH